MAYLSKDILIQMGFKSLGENVLISEKASFYNTGNIVIGSHVRIDDYCVLSAGNGGIDIGSYIHIAVFTSLIGNGRILLGNYVNLSSRVSIYSSNDDYSGEYMTNPMVPQKHTNVNHADVIIKKHVIVGSGSVVLPGSLLNQGAAIGALSLVNGEVPEFEIHAGVPAKKIKDRSNKLTIHEGSFEINKPK
jgi:acetyltransferase-like isoleucine patch superfamily enzyme